MKCAADVVVAVGVIAVVLAAVVAVGVVVVDADAGGTLTVVAVETVCHPVEREPADIGGAAVGGGLNWAAANLDLNRLYSAGLCCSSNCSD